MCRLYPAFDSFGWDSEGAARPLFLLGFSDLLPAPSDITMIEIYVYEIKKSGVELDEHATYGK